LANRAKPDPNPGEPEVLLEIESLAFGGEGVARLDGKVRFVAGALPGEQVTATRSRGGRRYDRMRLGRVLRRSPDRRSPLCPHVDYCGGCTLQQLRYRSQLSAKADQVAECLRRIGGTSLPTIPPPLPSPALLGYRNKMEFTFAGRPWLPGGRPETPPPGPALGLHVPGRFDAVFDLEHCALPGGRMIRTLHAVRRFARDEEIPVYRSREDTGVLRHLVIREGKNTGDLLAALVVRSPDPKLDLLAPALLREVPSLSGLVLIVNRQRATVARGEQEAVLHGRPFFRERLLDLRFELRAQSFFQTNTWGAEVLLAAVRERVVPRSGGRLLDLYCGVGTLGLGLAGSFSEVIGVEQSEEAVEDAGRNARLNGFEHVRFLRADVEAWLRDAGESPGRFDGIVVDPPRAGLHPKALRSLPALRPGWILYVSCNPATLARDAAGLGEAGYVPRELQVVDLFPHTGHVESILLFEPGRGG
jgi:23S rRNA (uracil1939-C5)-methyltransferase